MAPTGTASGTTADKDAEHKIRFDKDNDLPDCVLTATDLGMDEVHGHQHVHWNDGTHLMGGIIDNHAW
jgi:hypothetical protein